jgi:hypothetical protein
MWFGNLNPHIALCLRYMFVALANEFPLEQTVPTARQPARSIVYAYFLAQLTISIPIAIL